MKFLKKLYFLLIVIFLLLKGVQRNGSHNFLDVFYSLKKKLKSEYLSILCKLQFTTKKKLKKVLLNKRSKLSKIFLVFLIIL